MRFRCGLQESRASPRGGACQRKAFLALSAGRLGTLMGSVVSEGGVVLSRDGIGRSTQLAALRAASSRSLGARQLYPAGLVVDRYVASNAI